MAVRCASVSLVSGYRAAEKRDPCQVYRARLEKTLAGIHGAANLDDAVKASGRNVISRSVSGLNLASGSAGEITIIPNGAYFYRRSGNSTKRKWSREIKRKVMLCYYQACAIVVRCVSFQKTNPSALVSVQSFSG